MSKKKNASNAKNSINNSSSESKTNTTSAVNPAIKVKTSTLPTKVVFAENKKKFDQRKGN